MSPVPSGLRHSPTAHRRWSSRLLALDACAAALGLALSVVTAVPGLEQPLHSFRLTHGGALVWDLWMLMLTGGLLMVWPAAVVDALLERQLKISMRIGLVVAILLGTPLAGILYYFIHAMPRNRRERAIQTVARDVA